MLIELIDLVILSIFSFNAFAYDLAGIVVDISQTCDFIILINLVFVNILLFISLRIGNSVELISSADKLELIIIIQLITFKIYLKHM